MAIGIPFPEANTVLRAPTPEDATAGTVYDLHVHRYRDLDGNPNCISKWQFAPDELAAVVANGGAFWFHAWGATHPPVGIEGANPFVRATVAGEGQETLAERRRRRQGLSDHEAMADAQTGCVPCKLCGGKATISDAGTGAGYYVRCENSGAFRASEGCMVTDRRLGGWAYNVMDWWNRLHAPAAPAADPEEHPNARDYRNRAERAEAECAELRALLVALDRDARPDNWDDEPGRHADAWRKLIDVAGRFSA